MFYSDYNPPHFHAKYQGQIALFDINNSEVIAGKLSLRAEKMIKE
jgi:hypothetical protein